MTISVESQDAQHLLEQVADLRKLEDGWLDGEYGNRIAETALVRAEEAVSAMQAFGNIASGAFPTEEGGICFTWGDGTSLTADIEPDGSVYVHKADIAAGTCEDETLPVGDDLTRALARWLR